jgi:hypothetical protein
MAIAADSPSEQLTLGVSIAQGSTLTAAQCKGTFIQVTGNTGGGVLALPALAASLGCVIQYTGTGTLQMQTNGGAGNVGGVLATGGCLWLECDGTVWNVIAFAAAAPTTQAAGDNSTAPATDAFVMNANPIVATVVATAALSPANTYSAGVLTASATGTLTVDGHLTAVGDYVLVTAESAGANDGLYIVTTAGASGVSYVLKRANNATTAAQLNLGLSVAVGSVGTTYGGTVWTMPPGAYTVGTTTLTFTRANYAHVITTLSGTGAKTITALLASASARLYRVMASAVGKGTVAVTVTISWTDEFGNAEAWAFTASFTSTGQSQSEVILILPTAATAINATVAVTSGTAADVGWHFALEALP